MAVTRISTYAVHQGTLRDFNRVQAGLADRQRQLSSGLRTADFKGLTGVTEQFVDLEGKIRRLKTYEQNNDLVISRLQTVNTSLDQIVQTTDDLENLIVQWRNPGLRNNIPMQEQLQSLTKTLTAQLNQSVDSRYLFGGTRTEVPPVLDPRPEPVQVGVLDDSYYQGSKEDLVLRAQDNLELRYNIRADNSAFQKVFAGISQAAYADTITDDDEMVEAYNMIKDGLQEVIALQSQNNQNIVTLGQINDRHQTLALYYKGVTESLSKTDIVAVSTEVAVDQAVLTATFQTFAKINALRLSDFL